MPKRATPTMIPRMLIVMGFIATIVTASDRVARAVNPPEQGKARHERAVAAGERETTLDETAYLHLVNKHGSIFNIQGYARGTLELSTVTIVVTRTSAEFATATLTASSHTGTFSGRASVKMVVAGPSSYVKGTLEVTGGSGSYAKAHGRGLMLAGQFDRQNYHATVRLTGRVHL